MSDAFVRSIRKIEIQNSLDWFYTDHIDLNLIFLSILRGNLQWTYLISTTEYWSIAFRCKVSMRTLINLCEHVEENIDLSKLLVRGKKAILIARFDSHHNILN